MLWDHLLLYKEIKTPKMTITIFFGCPLKKKKKENSQMVPSEQRILIFLKIAIPNILLYTRLSIKSNNIFLLL